MNLMICLRGEPEHISSIPEIVALDAGVELGSYGLVGIQSEQNWQTRFALHQAFRAQFSGTLALHGPFIGMEFAHMDHLIRATVHRRLDMTFDVATKLKISRLILHSGYKREIGLFKLEEGWLKQNIAFWKEEIRRWSDAGIQIVLENETDTSPDLLVKLIDEVNNPALRLCLDIGHQHVFSDLGAVEWVRRMGHRLTHIHLHDNDGTGDTHWSLGRGTIDFEPFYAALEKTVPQATISLEVEDKIEVKLADLRKLSLRFRSPPL